MLRKAAIYVPLTIFALVTLVPFAYMFCSAIKPKSVLFNSTFLPTDGLFGIDESTGELKVVDVTMLPGGADASAAYEIEVAAGTLGETDAEPLRRTVTLGYGAPADAPVDLYIPADPAVNQAVGRLRVTDAGELLVEPVSTGEAAASSSSPDATDAEDAVVAAGETMNAVADPVAAGGEESVPGEADIAATDADAADPDGATLTRFEITEGNQRGALGIAWGLLTTDNFDRLFRGVPPDDADSEVARKPTGVWRAIVNSFFFASVSSVLATLGAAMGGYGLAKFRFRGRALIDNTVLAALVIPGALLIAPGYQLLYWFGLLDTYTGLILPGIAPAFGVFLFRQAMISSLPDEMIEAARIDGCGEIKMFFTMALPMARPMAGAFLLITYLGAWNNFIGPQIILQSPEKYPLAVWISQLRGLYGIDYGLIMAGTLVAIAPVLILFLMLQKEFIAGLTAGAVKG